MVEVIVILVELTAKLVELPDKLDLQEQDYELRSQSLIDWKGPKIKNLKYN